MKRKMRQGQAEPEDLTPEEQKSEALWERAFWRSVGNFLRDLFITVVIGVAITFIICVFWMAMEKYIF